MTSDTDGVNPEREPSDEELGAPVDLGAYLEDGLDDRFVERVQRGVHRRLLGSSVVEFCLIPGWFVLEFIAAVGSLFDDSSRRGGE